MPQLSPAANRSRPGTATGWPTQSLKPPPRSGSRALIHDQLRTGRLDSLKVGGRRIITREQIDKFLAGLAG
jgi:hypothetical protein